MTGRYKNYLGHRFFLSPWVGARPNSVLLLPPASFKMLAIAVGEGAKARHAIGNRFNMNDLQHPWTIQTLLLKLGFNMERNGKQWVNSDVDALSRRPRAPGARDSAREGTVSERKRPFVPTGRVVGSPPSPTATTQATGGAEPPRGGRVEPELLRFPRRAWPRPASVERAGHGGAARRSARPAKVPLPR